MADTDLALNGGLSSCFAIKSSMRDFRLQLTVDSASDSIGRLWRLTLAVLRIKGASAASVPGRVAENSPQPLFPKVTHERIIPSLDNRLSSWLYWIVL